MGIEFAEAYIEIADAVLEGSERVIAVHDWSALTGYGSGVRTRVTSWGLGVISRFDAIHVFSTSSVVRMGVTVANMALGGRIFVHDKRSDFERASAEFL